MGDSTEAEELARLRAKVADLESQLQGSGAIAQGEGNVAAGQGAMAAGRDKEDRDAIVALQVLGVDGDIGEQEERLSFERRGRRHQRGERRAVGVKRSASESKCGCFINGPRVTSVRRYGSLIGAGII